LIEVHVNISKKLTRILCLIKKNKKLKNNKKKKEKEKRKRKEGATLLDKMRVTEPLS